MIPLNHIIIDDVMFVYTNNKFELQCADCLFSQGVDVPERGPDGLVTNYIIKQYHSKSCRWASKNQGDDFLGNPETRKVK